MPADTSFVQRARELGPFWCLVRLVGAIPLLVLTAVVSPFSSDALSFLIWWEWVTLRPLVPRSRRYQAESGWVADGVPVHARGRTVTPLRPAGKIRVDAIVREARSEGEWIDAEADVRVVGSDAFGLIVRKAESG